jgi:hypothetical protein
MKFASPGSNISAEPNSEFGKTGLREFTSVLAKNSKSFSFIDCISVGVARNAAKSSWMAQP